MTINCLVNSYNIQFTDSSVNPIIIPVQSLNESSLPIALMGQTYKEYGSLFDENLLHILENFACPESSTNPGNPDLTQAISNTLSNPVIGSAWFNTTRNNLYIWSGTAWIRQGNIDDIAALSGIIMSGNQIPAPTSSVSGYTFKYSECVWFVSPYKFPAHIDYMECYTDSQANVISNFVLTGETTITDGYASFIILGIKNNNNLGTIATQPVPPPVTLSPTPTPAITATALTPTPTPTITPSLAASPTPSPTLSPTPTPTISLTPSVKPISATLFLVPSLGYPLNGNTTIQNTNWTSVGKQFPLNGFSLLVGNIIGGVGPYTVDFSNVQTSISMISINGGPVISAYYSYVYSGGSGIVTSPIRTGVSTQASAAYNSQTATLTNGYNYQITNTILAGSFITITDSVGTIFKLYTPSGLNGNIYGTSFNSPQGAFQYVWTCTELISG